MTLGLVAALAASAPTWAQTDERPAADLSALPAPTAAADAAPADERLGAGFDAADLDAWPSGAAAQLADWITVSGDNGGRPFMIVDKLGADVFVFDADGLVLAHAPVLVGIARGDDSAPGVGELALGAIPVDERTTPAGRFVAKFGPSDHGRVLWVDYADSISMHPVITTNPKEHRLARIRSASPAAHRISFGCINVPAKLYNGVLAKAFAGGGVVYVLPDTKTLAEAFPAYAAYAREDAGAGSQADRCADPLAETGGGIPASDPSLTCPIDDRQTADVTATH
ncbi:MAG TPA: L,D-transpeptidase [Caulobacteraceae bacterium]